MKSGLLSGVLWALDTVILGVALMMSPFSLNESLFLAPFVSAFLHDFFSSLWMTFYMIITKKIVTLKKVIKTKSAKFIVLGSILGGPVGMLGYVIAISNIGPAYTAVISSLYPAFGAFLSYVFLKEKMNKVQIFGLIISITGVILLGYTPSTGIQKANIIGFLAAILCVIGWSSEAVICSYGMKDDEVNNEEALEIRQVTSAIIYSFIIIPVINGFGLLSKVILTQSSAIILLSALFGTASYVFYYKAIYQIGPSKAMPLNITYSAWAVLFAFVIFNTIPSLINILFSIMIIIGSLIAASDFNMLLSLFKVGKNRK